jgi:hypothetical protein
MRNKVLVTNISFYDYFGETICSSLGANPEIAKNRC